MLITIQVVVDISPRATVLRDGQVFQLIIDGFDEPLECKQLKTPTASQSVIAPRTDNDASAGVKPNQGPSLDVIIPPEHQAKMGIEKLTPAEREYLRAYISLLLQYGPPEPKPNRPANPPSAAPASTQTSTGESQIDGDFEGWEGETIVKLTNGEIWQQTEYYYHYHYAFMPKVTIYKAGSGYKILVDGVPKPIGVTRLK